MTAKFNYGLGEVALTCDLCGEDESFSGDDFEEAMASAKMSGWRAVKEGRGWTNKCPDCATDFADG